jgi:hypothetical protein
LNQRVAHVGRVIAAAGGDRLVVDPELERDTDRALQMQCVLFASATEGHAESWFLETSKTEHYDRNNAPSQVQNIQIDDLYSPTAMELLVARNNKKAKNNALHEMLMMHQLSRNRFSIFVLVLRCRAHIRQRWM